MQKRRLAKKLPVGFICLSVLPAVIIVLMFIVVPTIQAMRLSLTDVGILSMKGDFVGLDNFAYLLKDDSFLQALKNTLKIMLVVPPITLFLAFMMAFLLQQGKLPERNLYITFFFLPNTISATVIAIVWSFVFHPNSGILNKLLELLGLEFLRHTWLGDSSTALWCIAATIIWSAFGYYMVLHLAGMDSISQDIYESATLDGAGFWRKLFSITFPLMKNILGITFVMSMSGVLGASFTYCTVMTNGGPNGASEVLLKYIYTQGMIGGNMGYSSAITVVTLVLAISLSLISRKLTSKSEKE